MHVQCLKCHAFALCRYIFLILLIFAHNCFVLPRLRTHEKKR
jgi:hypothetical protein